jgi:PAS domain S-box-containing protein
MFPGDARTGAEACIMAEEERSRLAALEAERRRLEERLAAQERELELLRARFARYELALRGSHVTVYTQDRDLKYTSISNAMFGRPVERILGRSDADILPAEGGAEIIAFKREVLVSGKARHAEFALREGAELRWYDLHVEPLRDASGRVFGLTCASVEVTERKESEAHLRLLLRELTHRSKNLLAVIQAMASQTARHAGSVEAFLAQFAARLQALASSHDLLVRESWYGASLEELVRSQIAAYAGHGDGQVAIEGPEIALKPEAAQNLGLALHELAINAKTFGALSVPDGRVSIRWSRRGDDDHNAIEINWTEQLGPKVKPRRKRGFGSLVIERNLARALGADVDLDFAPEGLRCRIVVPASQILAAR